MFRFTLQRAVACATALLSVASFAAAHEYAQGAITIDHPWARPTDKLAQVGAAYFTVKNAGPTDKLVAASADVAKSVELHRMVHKDGMMSMQHTQALAIPAKGTVAVKPGGYHVMLVGLKAPLAEGDKFPLQLTFEKAGKITVEVWVEKPKDGAAAPEHKHEVKMDAHGDKKH